VSKITLSKPQREALEKMGRLGACATTKASYGRFVSGVVMKSLCARGLARPGPASAIDLERTFVLTEEGMAELGALRAGKASP